MIVRFFGVIKKLLVFAISFVAKAVVKCCIVISKKPFLFFYKIHLKLQSRRANLGIDIKAPFLYFFSGTSIGFVLLVGLGFLVIGANAQNRNSDADFLNPHNILTFYVVKTEITTDEEEIAITTENEYSSLTANNAALGEDAPTLSTEASQERASDDIAFTTGALLKPTLPTTSQRRSAPNTIQEYSVKEGDTLSTIAKSFGLKIATITAVNNLRLTSTLQIGQKFTIPPVDGIIYKVKRGDTIQHIAKRYSSDPAKILAFNSLEDGSDIHVGQTLILPDGILPTPPTFAIKPQRTIIEKLKTIFTPPEDTSLPSRIAGMVWPTTARRITQYFSWRHPGLDIAGPKTNKIVAAADGTVIISGWQRGYGNTVVISHSDGKKTRYGHASKLFVSAGDRVVRGQTIAMVGNTGRSTGPHLHFELYVGASRVNPLSYIR
ncbi:M23 family metallopeptidase [Candidatus Uhrbacteria bacterium]|nr:M23 family metallopeptidase [Candidatus Uhrbacteria bacterium]